MDNNEKTNIDIPDIMQDIADTSAFTPDSDNAIIKVVGVGGGGCNAVSYMYSQNIPNVNFVVVNTDKQALEKSPVPTKLLLGPGLGAGNKPDVGKKYAEEYRDKIAEIFDEKTEMVFVTAGMGGGTGTGAGPVVAQMAKEAGKLTIGIVTVPFLFEGDKKICKAIEGAKEMGKHVDALLVINNNNLIELYPDLNFFNAFGKADDTLANAARSISEIISDSLYINVDFQDVRTTLKDSGTAIISTAIGEGEKRITNAINNALSSPLLKKHDIYTSQRLLLKFMCWKESPRPLVASEIDEITAFTSKLPKTIDVKWGIGDDPTLGDKVKITVLASGFDVTLDTNQTPDGSGTGIGRGPIVMQPDKPDRDETDREPIDDRRAIEEIYGSEKIKKHARDTAKIRYAVLTPDQFDDYEVIALLERTPAYNRKSDFNERLKELSNPSVRRESGNELPAADKVITF